jgi:hypothetical protein
LVYKDDSKAVKDLLEQHSRHQQLKGEEREFMDDFNRELYDLRFLEENQIPDEDYGQEIAELVDRYKEQCEEHLTKHGPDGSRLLYDEAKSDKGMTMCVTQLLVSLRPLGCYLMTNPL